MTTSDRSEELTTKTSRRTVPETVERFTGILVTKGLKVFAVIDQADEARQHQLELRPTTLIIFGNPAVGTPVMASSPESALDLPLKVVIWADGDTTKVTYLSPQALVARHHLDPDLAAPLAAIDLLTEALVAE